MGIPELTKEEYVRFEIAKAYIAAHPGYSVTVIRSDVVYIAEGVLNGKANPKAEPGDAGFTEKS